MNFKRTIFFTILGTVLTFGLGSVAMFKPQYLGLPTVRPLETAALYDMGIEQRMIRAGIHSISRSGERLEVVLRDGDTQTIRVCAWNEEVEQMGYCGRYTQGYGRSYTITSQPIFSYKGRELEPYMSKVYFVGWIESDLAKAEEDAARVKANKVATELAQSSWSN